MDKIIEVKCYDDNNNIVMHAQGQHATMQLLNILWQDKTCVKLAKVKYNTKDNSITVKTNLYTYEFNNVPLQWDGNIDISQLYMQHIQQLKQDNVI